MSTPIIPYQKPGLLEKLDLIPALGSIVLSGLFALLTGFWRSEKDEESLFLHVAYAIIRKFTARLSATQLQWVLPRTDITYEKLAKAAKVVPRTVELNHGAKGHWIGDPNAPMVLIWYHGGGFVLPAMDGHFNFFFNLIKSRTNNNLAIFFPTYYLSPTVRYPTQLIQCVEALRYILEERRHHPSHVIIGGDSAGGNIVAAVLSHLAHPHESIDKLSINEPLAAAILMCPWTAIDPETANFNGYYGADIETPGSLTNLANAYMGNARPDYYTDANLAPPEWFSTYPVDKIQVLAGGNELLLPNIIDLVNTLRAGFGRVEFYVAEKEAHIAAFMNLGLWSRPTRQGKKLMSWIEDLVPPEN